MKREGFTLSPPHPPTAPRLETHDVVRAPRNEPPPFPTTLSWSPASLVRRGYVSPTGSAAGNGLVLWSGTDPENEYIPPYPPTERRFGSYDHDGPRTRIEVLSVWFTWDLLELEAEKIYVDISPGLFDVDFVGNDPLPKTRLPAPPAGATITSSAGRG